MSTTQYFEEQLYPANKDGRADKSKPATTVELIRSSYYGDDQIYLKVIDEDLNEKILHLTKEQATLLANGLEGVCDYIGYDNA